MLRRHASLIVGILLVALVTTACIVRTRSARRSQPVYVEKQKKEHRKDHRKDHRKNKRKHH
jgi:hypothetical protein